MNCNRPPKGWICTREAGHEGPCAAYRLDNKWWYICNAAVAIAIVAGFTIYNVVALFHGMKP